MGFFELLQRRRRRGWDLIMERNDWFQSRALRALESYRREVEVGSVTLFCYSYTARMLFEYARSVGWKTVLGQIDPGPVEERIVAGLHAASPEFGGCWQPAPAEYWLRWREECRLADTVIVNSEWSRKALEAEGVPPGKLRIIPLIYDPPTEAREFSRRYPRAFTRTNPLRVLFLGQVNLRKGIAPVLQALRHLVGLPVRLRIAGPVQVELPEEFRLHPQVDWAGPLPRGAVGKEYRQADVFLLPTFSDGFGLTQLEAQAWRLPLIVSRFCGTVVDDGCNGIVLDPVNADKLAEALLDLVRCPDKLAAMSRRSSLRPEHLLEGLVDRWREAVG